MAEGGGVAARCVSCSKSVLDTAGVEVPVEVKHHHIEAGICRIIIYITLFLVFMLALHGHRSFQEKSEAVSTLRIHIEGVLHSTDNDSIWDVPDYVINREVSSFAITVKQKKTHQKVGRCEEDPTVEAALCQNDSDCLPIGTTFPSGHGFSAGKCRMSSRENVSVCEIDAWCPVEDPSTEPSIMLSGLEKITFSVKNWIKFAEFGTDNSKYGRNNFRGVGGRDYDLSRCFYDKDDSINQFCPRFKMADAVRAAGQDLDELMEQGGIIGMIINWECDLDIGLVYCTPRYTFTRLDQQGQGGWTMRIDTDHSNGTRDLVTVTGIRFTVRVTGAAWRFSLENGAVTVGSWIGYFGAVTTFCVLIIIPLLSRCWYHDYDDLQAARTRTTVREGQPSAQSSV